MTHSEQLRGVGDNYSRYFVLHYNCASTIEAIKSQITEQYAEISLWITDQSKLYWWMDDLGHLRHSVYDHQHHLYRSTDGYSSNRLEGAFAHLNRMWVVSTTGSPGKIHDYTLMNLAGGGVTSTYPSSPYLRL